jgi:uncharacterized protein YndB with AHSA1/START domain
MTKDDKGPVLEITRIFDAPPARVFEAWLDRDEWASWIGPEGVRCDLPLFEPRVDGRYRLTMHLPASSRRSRTTKVSLLHGAWRATRVKPL